MAKLRKMLGSIEDPSIIAMMGLIETQSKETLIKWSVTYAREHFLGIYEKAYGDDSRLRHIISAVQEYQEGKKTLKEVKPIVKEANLIAKEAEGSPAAQAAARAIATACSTIQSPTGALGFTFYGAAAVVYDQAGLEERQAVYDAMAAKELERILGSLQEAAVPDEENPVKINWNC